MGFVDRGGSRESKGNSLRRSKKNPGAAAARAAGAKQAIKPPAQPEVPPALAKANKRNDYFDAAAALLSRQFDADIDDVLDRAEQNCAGVLVWSADIDKQQQVVMMAQENAGFVYATVGLHPDNVRGTHQREFDKWFQQVEDVSKMRGCVAILSGLNLLRETATHFPQEHVLKTMFATAKKNGRPLMLHCAPRHNETAERLLVLLEEFQAENGGAFPVPVIMHTFLTATNFNAAIAKKFAALGAYMTVSAAELHDLCGGVVENADGPARTPKQIEDDLAAFVDCLLNVIPAAQIFLASDSPWHTPQTIDDDYVRSQKNEPSNFPNIVEALELAINTFAKKKGADNDEAPAMLAKLKSLIDNNKDLALKVFGIPEKDAEVVVSAAEAVPVASKHGKDTKKGKHDDDEDEDDNGNKKSNKKSTKGGKHLANDDEDEDDNVKGSKKGKGTKKGKKGVRFGDSEAESDAEEEQKSGKLSKNTKGKRKGGKGGDSDSEDEAPKKGAAKKGEKKSKNDSDSDDKEIVQPAKAGRKGAAAARSADSLHYACLKCRTKLFLPSDLIVPDDASLSNAAFFVKVNTSPDAAEEFNEEEEEDENQKYLPGTLKITANTNGEIECRKCGAPKMGRAGFKLGVPGFGIKITPSKVEVVDTEITMEELQRRAMSEAERFQQEAEDEENASSDDDKKVRVHKKNVKTNNRSNFTHFRNKNFAPKGLKTEEIAEQPEQNSDSEEEQKKGKRRK